jgi:hypothetical protein
MCHLPGLRVSRRAGSEGPSRFGPSAASIIREPNTKKKIVKPSKPGNRIESRIGLKENQQRLALLVSLIEPFERLLVLPQTGRRMRQKYVPRVLRLRGNN